MRCCRVIIVLFLLLFSFGGNLPWDFNGTGSVSASTVVSGEVWGTWTEANSPYILDYNVTIPYGKTLIIEPGVKVTTNKSYEILIEGKLYANGSNDKRIVFTSENMVYPHYFWKGIKFNITGTGVLQNCTINNSNKAITLSNSKNVIIKDSIVSSNVFGLYLENKSVNNSIINCSIFYNYKAISSFDSHNNLFINCNISNNTYDSISFVDSDNNSINNILVESNFYGIQFFRSNNNSIYGSKILNNYGSSRGMELWDHSTNTTIHNTYFYNNQLLINNIEYANVSITHCEFTYEDGPSINIRYSGHINISNCIFYSRYTHIAIVHGYEIDINRCQLLPMWYILQQDEYIDEVMSESSPQVVASISAIDIYDGSKDISIDYCELVSFDQDVGISIRNSKNLSIFHSDITNFGTWGIYAYSSSIIELTYSNVTNNYQGYFFESCEEISVISCEIIANYFAGLYFNYCEKITAKDCMVYNNGRGLVIDECEINIEIIDCTILNNKGNGFEITSSSNLLLEDIKVKNSGNHGLNIMSSNPVLIKNCDFNENNGSGLSIKSSTTARIYSCNILDNKDTGVELDYSYVFFENCTISENIVDVEVGDHTNLYLINTSLSVAIVFNANNLEVYIGWFLDIVVLNPSGTPVPYAKVTIQDNSNLNDPFPFINYLTDSTGKVEQLVSYEYFRHNYKTYDYNPYTIIAQKDGIGYAIEQINITKNTQLQLQLKTTDILISNIEFENSSSRIPLDKWVNLSVIIQNNGAYRLEDIDLQVNISGKSYHQGYYYQLDNISSGKTAALDIYTMPGLIEGDYKVEAFIDFNDNIFETNEDNNGFNTQFKIVARPTAVLEANRTSVYIGESITFDGGSSFSPDKVAILEYIFDFGDGSKIQSLTQSTKVQYNFSMSGSYIVKLKVKDQYGIYSNFDKVVIIVIQPENGDDLEKIPIALFTVEPGTGYVYTTFVFDPSASQPSKGANIIRHYWSFGDNQTSEYKQPEHMYSEDGTFVVSLKVEDSLGKISEYFNRTILIKNQIPKIFFTANRTIVKTGEPISFNASGTYDIDDSLFEPGSRFIWYFDDEEGSEYAESSILAPDGRFDKSTIFTFYKPGIYNVTLVVYDDDGARNQSIIKITVLPGDQTNGGGDNKGSQGLLPFIYLMGLIFIVIIIIVIVTVILVIRRKKKRQDIIREVDDQTSLSSSGYSDTDFSKDGSGINPFIATKDDKGARKSKKSVTSKKKKDRKKKGTDKTKVVSSGSRIGSVKPLEVSVTPSDEKIVFWKGDLSAMEHKLTLDDVEVVTDKELLSASMIGLNGSSEAEDEFDQMETYVPIDDIEESETIDIDMTFEEDLEPVTEFEPEEELEVELKDEGAEWEISIDDEDDDNETELDTMDELADGEFEEEEYYASEDIMDDEDRDDKENEIEGETLVFEIDEDGDKKSSEIKVRFEEVPLEDDEFAHVAEDKKVGKSKHKKERLIPIPGVGFVTKSELEKALDSRYKYQHESEYRDTGYDYTGIPAQESYRQTKPISPIPKPQEPLLYCEYCGKSIRGKYIKFKRKDEMGISRVVGPFCSQDCAKLSGK